MGMGATNTLERMVASVGQRNRGEPSFVTSMDVPNAEVLFALPALWVSGLLKRAGEYVQLPRGYSRTDSIFLLLGFMALSRIKKGEDLRYCPPGEWGKMLGLDRIPEVKTLREKIGLLSNNDRPSEWTSALSSEWRERDLGAYNNLGIAYYRKGMTDEAEHEFKKTIAIEPYHAEAHNDLGILYNDRRLYDNAIKEFETAVHIKPTYANAHMNLGVVLLKHRKDKDAALFHLKESIKTDTQQE